MDRVKGGWLATGRTWRYDHQRYDGLAALRRAEHAMMERLTSGELADQGRCLMQFLATALDDPDASACGRCQGCTGWTPEVDVDPDALRDAREHLRSRDVLLRPRRQWPSGLDEVKGRIGAGRGPLEGRALAGDDDSGWAGPVDRLLAAARAGESLPEDALDEAMDGIVQVLKRWGWRRRPVAVVPVPSRTLGGLTAEVARRIGEVGRLPVVPALVRADGPSQSTMRNSPHKAGNALARLRLDPAAAADLPPGPVLVVDAVTDSGWTLTVAAHRLTEPGERDVLPLVLTSGPA